MPGFEIDAYDLGWILGTPDEPDDRCLHGHAVAVIGGERLEYDCTVSATALMLLKSLTEDHIAGEGEQMLPCCGHFLVADEGCENVYISGCGNGVDWTVRHENGAVRLITPTGHEVVLPLAEYSAAVCRFADKVAAYYAACSPKTEPTDDFDRRGWLAFRREWSRRRQAAPGGRPTAAGACLRPGLR